MATKSNLKTKLLSVVILNGEVRGKGAKEGTVLWVKTTGNDIVF